MSTEPSVAAAAYGSRLLGRTDQSTRSLRVRVQLLLTAVLLIANLIGAVVVAALLLLVRPSQPVSDAYWLAHAIAVPVYVAAAAVIGVLTITRALLRVLTWAREDRAPREEEVRATLRAPRLALVRQGVLWAGGVALFTGLPLWLEPQMALTEGIAVTLAGVLVCAISYLWTEFILRPITARALVQGPPPVGRTSGVHRRLIVFWVLGTGVPVAVLMLCGILALAGDDQVDLTRLAVLCLVLGGVVLLFGYMIIGLTSRSIVAPIASVRHALAAVEEGRLDVVIPVYDATEIGHLQSGFNRMAAGLRERERIRDLFGRHVGQEVAAAAVSADVELGGETRVVSVLFVDLMGSTAMATRLEPHEVVTVLNRFCAVVVDEVDRAGGLVNKFMGDAVLAVFGAPVPRDDHATAALRAARAIAARLTTEVPEIRAGVGVATGEAVAGNVGDERRFEYTVIGDAVNSAARLTELAKKRPGLVLAAETSVAAAAEDEAARWHADGEEVLRGRTTPTGLAVPRSGGSAQASETSSA